MNLALVNIAVKTEFSVPCKNNRFYLEPRAPNIPNGGLSNDGVGGPSY